MDVEAHPATRAQPACQPLFGALEICWQCELLECWIALDRRDLHAGGSHDRCLVGRRGALPKIIGRFQCPQAEGLGSLDARETDTIHGIAQRVSDLREGIADWQYGRCTVEE